MNDPILGGALPHINIETPTKTYPRPVRDILYGQYKKGGNHYIAKMLFDTVTQSNPNAVANKQQEKLIKDWVEILEEKNVCSFAEFLAGLSG